MSTTMTTTSQKNSNADQELANKNDSREQIYQASFSPRFDLWEGDDELILYGDLPGVDPDDLEIQIEGRQLTLHGKVRPRFCCVEYLHSEYGVGDFHRTFMIGESIDSDLISAELKDGVLTLRLPKVEDAKPRRIEVKIN